MEETGVPGENHLGKYYLPQFFAGGLLTMSMSLFAYIEIMSILYLLFRFLFG
jgi:hypothetical protein